ncbi:MAG: hypothetical protein ACKOWF_03930 [Chloroflexota bacterium]
MDVRIGRRNLLKSAALATPVAAATDAAAKERQLATEGVEAERSY